MKRPLHRLTQTFLDIVQSSYVVPRDWWKLDRESTHDGGANARPRRLEIRRGNLHLSVAAPAAVAAIRRSSLDGTHRRFSAQRRDVCAAVSFTILGHRREVDVIIERKRRGVKLENVRALPRVRQRHLNLAIESSRSPKRGIYRVRSTRRRHHGHGHIVRLSRAVHQRQELRHYSVFVRGAPLSRWTQHVELIYHDHARFPALHVPSPALEHLAQSLLALPRVRAHDVTAAHRERLYARLVRHRPHRLRLPRSRWTVQE